MYHCICSDASYKSIPSSLPQSYVDSYAGSPGRDIVLRVTTKRWLTGLWSTQDKVEGSMLRAAWHWDSDSSVVKDPLGEPGRTP